MCLSCFNRFIREHDMQKQANEELRSLLINQVLDPERMLMVLRLISETNEFQKSATKRELIRVIIILAQVFEEKLVDYLPKILSIMAKRIKEEDPQVNAACAEATKAIISISLKGLSAEQFTEQLDLMLKSYLAIFPKAGKEAQIGAAMCISKIVQTSPIECVYPLSDNILQRLIELLKTPWCKAHLQILEALMSLVSATEDNPEKLVKISETLFPVAMNYLDHPDSNVRKTCVEIIYAFNIFTPGLIISNKSVIVDTLERLRGDKVKNLANFDG